MTEDTQDNEARGRSADPAVDAAEHLLAAVGTEAWPQARDRVVGLLPDGGDPAGARVRAWAAEAQRLDGTALDRYLADSLPRWRREIATALADDPQRAEQARAFADSVRSLLPAPGDGAAQVAAASGHGTVNAVQNGNLYYQVVFGLAPRPRRTLGRGATAAATGAAAAAAVAGGLAAEEHLASAAVRQAGAGSSPPAPLADPAPAAAAPQAAASHAAPQAAPSQGGAGAAATAEGGTGLVGKVGAAVAKAVGGAGAGGFGVPAVVTVVSVVVVAVTTVTVVVKQNADRGSCDGAARGRTPSAALAEAARRVELTSFRFDVTRGAHHVTGAADPRSRAAWFTQGLAGGPVVSGTIRQGKVVLPAGADAPPGTDPRWVRTDGAFTDAVDPAAPARLLGSAEGVRRSGCTFTGTLVRTAEAAAAAAPAPRTRLAAAESPSPSAPSGTASTSPPPGTASAPFTARIDHRGRLVRLAAEATAADAAVSARYWDFGLAVTPSAPPSASSPAPSASAEETLAGEWTGTWSAALGGGTFTAALAQDGDRITGDLAVAGTPCSLDGPVSGTLDGDRITFGTVESDGRITFAGRVDGASMNGTYTTDCYGAEGSWQARRPAP